MAERSPKKPPSWIRHASIGIEYVAAVVGFAFVGWWIDSRWDSSPWGVIIGATLGLIGGTYNLIRATMSAFRTLPKRDASDDEDRQKHDH